MRCRDLVHRTAATLSSLNVSVRLRAMSHPCAFAYGNEGGHVKGWSGLERTWRWDGSNKAPLETYTMVACHL